jgi:hypothetical protein
MDDLHEEHAHDAMIDAVSKAKDAAKATSFEQLAKEYGAKLHHTGMIKPDDNKKIQELDKKDLPARAMLGLDKVGALMVGNGDRENLLIKLDAIEGYNQDDFAAELKDVKSLLTNNRTKMQVESVVASLHRNATIETNESTPLAGEEYSE